MKNFFFMLIIVFPLIGVAQDHTSLAKEHHDEFRKFKISFAFAQTYIPSYYIHEESESAQLIPTDGIEIQYNFNHKFFVKWTNEIEFLNYTLKNHEGEQKVRDNAFLSIVTFGYEFYDKFAIVAGAGYEFEKSKNLWVCRLGLEYSIPFGKNWELSPEILYDIKKDSHTAISWGFGIGYRL
ncbi:MAG: hypothetical protein C0598_07335 [Marinilabiliales bacterium]|nr:MAG: hypothetical protein C0598_07335 [Marinilabiliales bacterium]